MADMEDPEEHGRAACVRLAEIIPFKLEAESNAIHDRLRCAPGLAHERENQRFQLGHGFGIEVGAMQRQASLNARICGAQLLAEIEAFLQVRLAGGQLAPDREEAAPGASAVRHRNLHFDGFGQGKEAMAKACKIAQRRRRNPMSDGIEKAKVPAGGANFAGDAR